MIYIYIKMGVDYFVCECCDDEPFNTYYSVVINIYPRDTEKAEHENEYGEFEFEYSKEKILELIVCTQCWEGIKENVIIMGESGYNGGYCIKLKENKKLSYYQKKKVVINK